VHNNAKTKTTIHNILLVSFTLGAGVVSCNYGEGLRNGLYKDASRSDKLVRELDNVPRAFTVGKLKKLEIVPEVPEKEGTAISIVTEDRSIVSMWSSNFHDSTWINRFQLIMAFKLLLLTCFYS
jgi:hypothetical protein